MTGKIAPRANSADSSNPKNLMLLIWLLKPKKLNHFAALSVNDGKHPVPMKWHVSYADEWLC
jgi:hypothetical protein